MKLSTVSLTAANIRRFHQILCPCSWWSSSHPKTSSVSGTGATAGSDKHEHIKHVLWLGACACVCVCACVLHWLTTMVRMKPVLKRATGRPMATLMAMDIGQMPQSAGQLRQFSSSSQTSSPHTETKNTFLQCLSSTFGVGEPETLFSNMVFGLQMYLFKTTHAGIVIINVNSYLDNDKNINLTIYFYYT